MTGRITLYKVASDLRELFDSVDPETGELPAEFGLIRDVVAQKTVAVASYIAQDALETDAIEARVKEISARIKARRSRQARLRGYLAECMKVSGVRDIRSEDDLLHVRLYEGRDKSVDVYDESLLPKHCLRTKTIIEPDKNMIRQAIEAGEDVQGARIVAKDRLVIE